ncbi:MAG TPA: helix-turn-helix transcriptional regulator [Mycobacteriales bacterium]|nr:helix-turn-helix transcriptional regulator [Mycobacteriales bacterium]
MLVAFGHTVRAAREERGLSQAALADAAGIHPTYLSGIERGRRNVALRNVRAIADALGVEVRDLFA